MNMIQGLKIVFALTFTGLLCTACQKEETAPAPATTNAPVVAAPVPTNAAVPALTTNVPATNAVTTVVLTPQEAKAHIGEEATVRGEVFGVHITAKGDAFINVGAAYPDAPFTAVCFQGAIPADDLKKLEGKTVSFKGKIKEHNGSVEIILDSAEQIVE